MLYRGEFDGGCFCRAIRYRFVDVFDAGYCHCSICRRTSGAPVIAWANTPRNGFTITDGTQCYLATSERFRRAFCDRCGTLMWTESIDPQRWDMISVHHGTIDRAAEIEPAIHLCFADRLAWLRIDDNLPRVQDNTLKHPAKRGDARWSE